MLILEELLPFFFYLYRAKIKLQEAGTNDEEKNKLYGNLSTEERLGRLKEEHERGKSIDEKTIKYTVTISLALTILGSAGGIILGSISIPELALLASVLIALSVIYTISGGLLALGALKTLPTYGFGTVFLLNKKSDDKIIARALVSQEKVNIVRHLRNESSYQCLRNGLLLLLAALFIYTIQPTLKYIGVNGSTPKLEYQNKTPEMGSSVKESKSCEVKLRY